MHRTGTSTKLSKGFTGAQRRSVRLLAMLGLVAVIAASCSSDTATAAAADTGAGAGADEQSSVTTTAAEIETTTTTATTTTEPEPDIEDETRPAPDATLIAFVEAFGIADVDLAFSFVSPRCQEIISENDSDGYAAYVASYGADNPGATPSNISAVVNGDVAAVSYDNHNSSGEYVESYISQPWMFSDGKWQWDAC